MKSTRDSVLVIATRHRRLDPVDVDRHRDFDAASIARVQREIESCGARDGDAILLEPDSPLQVMRLCDLLAWLRDNDLAKLAARVERTFVPPGEIVALVLGDEDARVRTMKLPPQALPRSPLCTALRLPR